MHPSHDALALLALGEPAETLSERQHIADCPRCRDEIGELSRLVDPELASAHPTPHAPPDHVWDRIAAELGFGRLAASSAASLSREALSSESLPSGFRRTDLHRGDSVAGDAGTAADLDSASHIGLGEARPGERQTPRRRRFRVGAVLVAVLALIVGIGIGLGAGIGISDLRQPDRDAVLATAALTGRPGWTSASGEATVRMDGQGRRRLVITMTAPPVGDALTEAWLARRDLSGMIALGQLSAGSGTFVVPAGVDLSRYPVVDVSREELDGDVSHSDESIIRGRLG